MWVKIRGKKQMCEWIVIIFQHQPQHDSEY